MTAALAAVLQKGQYPIEMDSLVNFIVAPDVKQDDLLPGDHQGKSYPVTVGKTDGVTVFQLSAETVQLEVGLKRVLSQVIDDLDKRFFQVWMYFEEFLCPAKEAIRRIDGRGELFGSPSSGPRLSCIRNLCAILFHGKRSSSALRGI